MALAICLAIPAQAIADEKSDRLESLEKRLADSLKLIERLESRVSELEHGQGSRTPSPAGAVEVPSAVAAPSQNAASVTTTTQGQAQAQAQAIAKLQEDVGQLSEGLSKTAVNPGLPLHGFADVGAGWSAGSDPAKLRGFNVGTLDLYLVPQFSGRVRALIEAAFEYDPAGTDSTVDVERLQLGYTLQDDLTVWFGRFHTPFGLWNTYYHHGANLQTAIFRPRFIEFEDKGGIIPAHSIGAWASGKFALGGDKVLFDTYITNGPSIRERTLDFNALTDDDGNKMLGFNVGYQPAGLLHGLTLGVHGFASRATAYSITNMPMSRTRLRMGGGYFGYDANDWEAIGEFYRFSDRGESTGVTAASRAWFTQIGRNFGAWTPFVRYEYASLNPQDAYFMSQQHARSYRRAVAGARYALDSRSSLKFELSTTREDPLVQIDESGAFVQVPLASYRRLVFQYSIAF